MPRIIVSLSRKHESPFERTVDADSKNSALEQVLSDPAMQEHFGQRMPPFINVELEFNRENLPSLLLDVPV
jgi:hypothetical protein